MQAVGPLYRLEYLGCQFVAPKLGIDDGSAVDSAQQPGTVSRRKFDRNAAQNFAELCRGPGKSPGMGSNLYGYIDYPFGMHGLGLAGEGFQCGAHSSDDEGSARTDDGNGGVVPFTKRVDGLAR